MEVRENDEEADIKEETALCNECLMPIPCELVVGHNTVLLSKTCGTHGTQKVVLSTDPIFWGAAKKLRDSLEVSDRGTEPSLKPYMLMLEIIDECNVGCPTCIAASRRGDGNIRQKDEVVERVRKLTEQVGHLDLIMVTGGEPTLHPQLIEILLALKQYGTQVMLITHGQRIAEDPDFVECLSKIGPNFEVYLQFDSMRKHVLEELRGRDYRSIRNQALENLSSCGIATTLICVIKKGFNDDEVGEIVKHAIKFNNIRGVTFQPIRSSGRHTNFCHQNHSITLSEVRSNLIRTLGVGEHSLVSHPLNPESICVGYFSRYNFPHSERTSDLFSLDSMHLGTASSLLYLPQEFCSNIFGDPHLFRITTISFLDKYNYTSSGSLRSRIKFLTDDGSILTLDDKFIYDTYEERSQLMDATSKYVVVMTTTGNEEDAEKLAKKIIEAKLAACIQVQQIKSFYMWKGESCCDPECLLFIKTRSDLYSELQSFIVKNHSYETPEIIKVPIGEGYPAYLSWINEVTNA